MRGFSLFLLALGAVLAFAVNLVFEEVDLFAVGIIFMIVGAIGLIAGMVRTGSSTRVVRDVSADGSQIVEQRRTTGY